LYLLFNANGFNMLLSKISLVVYATSLVTNIRGAKIPMKELNKFFAAMNKVEKLLSILEANPADSFIQHALALEYIKSGEEEKAKKLFQSILQREPGYVGSYYHLAKLFERIGENKNAIAVYEKGMEESKKAGDNHTYNELKAAYEALTF
jgi:Tfp pilus assembly protein PilF